MKRILLFILMMSCLLKVYPQQVTVERGDVIDGYLLVNGKSVPSRFKVWRTGKVHGHVRLGADEYGQPCIDTATVGRIVIPDSIVGPDGKYYLVKAVARQAFAHCRHITEVIVPEELYDFGDQSFLDCASLKEITVPARTKHIYPCAFRNCPRLRIIHIKCITLPQTYSDVFDRHTIEHGTLFIPAGTTSLYAESQVWGMFAHRFEMIE